MRDRSKEEMELFRMREVGGMRKRFPANPDTDQERFLIACAEAEDFAKRSNYDTIVFKNSLGFYMTREYKFARIDIANGEIEVLFCALAKFCATTASKKKVAWKLREDHKTR